MKTEDLKAMGLTQEQIDKVMAENGKDIEAEKAKIVAKEAELNTANQTIKDLQETAKKYDGKDPTKLESDLKALQSKYDTDILANKLSSALDLALVGAKARDIKAVKPFLNTELIRLDGDKLLGFDEQLKNIKETKSFLFDDEKPVIPVKTGMRQTGNEGTPDKKEEANAAFRSLFGKENQ